MIFSQPDIHHASNYHQSKVAMESTTKDTKADMAFSTDPDEPSENPIRKDYQLLLLMILLKLGDTIETYLPGIITQTVSCELGISEFQESVLAVIFYILLSITILISAFISKLFGERLVLVLSLYSSIVFVILSAIFPNYYTLLLSRAVAGISVGFTGRLSDVYLVKLASSKTFLAKDSFLAEGLAISVGVAWVFLLAWLVLDLVGWRIYILMTSTPFFLPSIIILHCCLKDNTFNKGILEIEPKAEETSKPPETEVTSRPRETDSLVGPMSDPKFFAKAIRSSLFSFSSVCIGYGSIILLPWMMRRYKLATLDDTEDGTCKEVVRGSDFLTFTLVMGVPTIVGNILGYFLWSRAKFLIPHVTVTSATVFSFSMILTKPNFIAIMILFGVTNLCYSIQSVELTILHYDYEYFGKLQFELGTYISAVSSGIGAVFGTCFSAFLDPFKAVTALVVFACTELALTLL